MEKEIRLKDGRTVLVRDVREDEDVFDMARFINELVDEGSFLTTGRMTPEGEADWLRGKMREVAEGHCIMWAAMLGDKRVGACEARRGKGAEAKSAGMGIALSKEVRRQGLGTQMLSMLIEEVKKQWSPAAISLFRFDANEPAKALYEKIGFVECGRIPNALTHNGKQMDKVLMVLK